MTLEYEIFVDGTKISPSLDFLLIFGRQTVPAKNAWRLPLLSLNMLKDRLFSYLSFCLVTSQANYSMSEGLAIGRLTRHKFLLNKARAIQWLPP